MKVLFLLDAFGFFGGPERRAFRIARGLKTFNKWDVEILSIMKPDPRSILKAQEFNIPSHAITSEGNKALKSYRLDVFLKLKTAINEISPDVVFTFEFLADYTTKMALLGKTIPILTFIGSTEWKWEHKRHRKIPMKRFVKKSKFYVVNSLQVKENLLRVLPNTFGKIKLLYNPIDTEYFKPVPRKTKIKTRKTFGINDSDFVIGSVVRFYNPKGADVLIEAFHKSGINAKLVLVGDGSQRETLENMVKSLHIEDRVLFLGALEATPEIYSIFDVTVVPSQKGGFDNVVVESMACGIPTVATEATGIGEIAKHGEHLYITQTSTDALSEGIKLLFNNPKLAVQMSHLGRKLIVEKLNLNRTCSILAGWLQDV